MHFEGNWNWFLILSPIKWKQNVFHKQQENFVTMLILPCKHTYQNITIFHLEANDPVGL